MYQRLITKYQALDCFIIVLFIFFASITNAQKPSALKFNQDGKFKIVQFTDVHLKVENKPRCDSVINTIKTVLEKEKPDLVMLTGDVCTTSEKVKEAWSTVTKPMADAKIPWAAVMGNHEHEHGFTNKQIIEYLTTLPYNFSQVGPKIFSVRVITF
jgi:predicted MPP superfamily phosphohydrolase